MLLRQCCLCNNLPAHLIENTDFPQQKPLQSSSGEAKFKD